MKKQTHRANGSWTPVCYVVHEEPQSENRTAVDPQPQSENQTEAHGEQPQFENRTVYIGQSSSNKEKKSSGSPSGERASRGDFQDELQAVYDKKLSQPQPDPDDSPKTPG
jgi:hypothetical protein